jgi:hypothetical protein
MMSGGESLYRPSMREKGKNNEKTKINGIAVRFNMEQRICFGLHGGFRDGGCNAYRCRPGSVAGSFKC